MYPVYLYHKFDKTTLKIFFISILFICDVRIIIIILLFANCNIKNHNKDKGFRRKCHSNGLFLTVHNFIHCMCTGITKVMGFLLIREILSSGVQEKTFCGFLLLHSVVFFSYPSDKCQFVYNEIL